MKRKRTHNPPERLIRKALVFERALHSWQPWLDSILQGRKVLRFTGSNPSFHQMRNLAKNTLAVLGFPPCSIFELYWLCCVFSDYETLHGKVKGFTFEQLVLPDWFPLPFGVNGNIYLDLKGKRIYPPEVWDEADREFHFVRDPLIQILAPEKRPERFQDYPDNDFIMVLHSDHPVIKLVKRGRPGTTDIHGETFLD